MHQHLLGDQEWCEYYGRQWDQAQKESTRGVCLSEGHVESQEIVWRVTEKKGCHQ